MFPCNIDHFASGRLTVQYASIKEIGITGKPFYIFYGKNEGVVSSITTPHNFLINCLIEYGVIAGVLFMILLIICLGWCFKRAYKREMDFTITFLWTMFSTVVMCVLTVNWKMPMLFLLLVFWYPIFKKVDEQSQSM